MSDPIAQLIGNEKRREEQRLDEAGDSALRDLPDRVVVGANGAYWRDYGDHYSMAVVSEDNDPVVPIAVYVRARGLDYGESRETLTTDEVAALAYPDPRRPGIRHSLAILLHRARGHEWPVGQCGSCLDLADRTIAQDASLVRAAESWIGPDGQGRPSMADDDRLDLADIVDEIRPAISNAYYDARNAGDTMEDAASRAAGAVLAILQDSPTLRALGLMR